MALLGFMQQNALDAYGTPPFVAPQNQNLSMAMPTVAGAPEPFVWGAGGARMTPEQIAAQRAIAQQQMQSDFSPVGSVWEGLGRVANNVTGALDARNLRKTETANADRDAQIAQLLLGGDASAVNQALLDPTLSDTTRGFAELQYGRLNPKPQAPTEFERMLQASGVQPGSPEWVQSMQTAVQNKLDPFTNVVAGGNTIMGRQSMVEQALGGGQAPVSGAVPSVTDQASYDAVPAGTQYRTPDGSIRVKGGPAQSAPGGF